MIEKGARYQEKDRRKKENWDNETEVEVKIE
jgi:hypothetical protein